MGYLKSNMEHRGTAKNDDFQKGISYSRVPFSGSRRYTLGGYLEDHPIA